MRLPIFGYLLVCLSAVFFGYSAINAPLTFIDLVKEDSWVENFTAIWLFLAGILLIATAFRERRVLPLCIYILTGVAFFFAAGEEISWGQRIFGFDTPDSFMDLNRQHEFNIHNIAALRAFMRVEYYGALIFCVVTYAALFCKKVMVLGVPLPSIPLVFAFMVMLSHMPIRYGSPFYVDLFISSPGTVLLLLFIIHMIFEKQTSLVIAAISTMTIVLVFSYVYSANIDSDMVFPAEIREYLFGFCCFLYSLELLLLGRVRQTGNSRYRDSVASFDLERFGFDLGEKNRVPFSLTVSFFVITGSIWLVPLKYFDTAKENQIAKDTIIQDTRLLIKHDDPIIRSNFDVYLKDNKLLYVKEECNKEDINRFKFFVHIVPTDQADLPYYRQQFGFDNFDFFSRDVDGFYDDKHCIVVRFLPDYDIASISTGQYIIRENKAIQIWKGAFTFGNFIR